MKSQKTNDVIKNVRIWYNALLRPIRDAPYTFYNNTKSLGDVTPYRYSNHTWIDLTGVGYLSYDFRGSNTFKNNQHEINVHRIITFTRRS